MFKFSVNTVACALAGALIVASSGAAFAAGESGGGSMTTTTPPKCKEGEVWDPEAKRLFGKGKCVAEADFKGTQSDKQGLIYDYGKSLAKAGEYDHAIQVLAMAPDQGDAKLLNYMGYSHRKLGHMDEALGYYRAAVAADPDFSLVREYLGEAYIQLGLLEKAREQLSEIERICGGRECGEYGQLANLIVDSQIAN
jgi:tetratricopeptide (TPR) repeat protein